MVELFNLTPHTLNVWDKYGRVTEIPASGTVARVSSTKELVEEINGCFPVFKEKYGEVIGLPEPKDGVLFVVSRLVKAARPERTDLLVPGELLRDDNGNPCGCKGFAI